MISIHAPAKGATKKTAKKLKRRLFQSTLPRRERHGYTNSLPLGHGISIHAPAKGATIVIPARRYDVIISIHAPAKGATSSCKPARPL